MTDFLQQLKQDHADEIRTSTTGELYRLLLARIGDQYSIAGIYVPAQLGKCLPELTEIQSRSKSTTKGAKLASAYLLVVCQELRKIIKIAVSKPQTVSVLMLSPFSEMFAISSVAVRSIIYQTLDKMSKPVADAMAVGAYITFRVGLNETDDKIVAGKLRDCYPDAMSLAIATAESAGREGMTNIFTMIAPLCL